jgi:hypothetical protein
MGHLKSVAADSPCAGFLVKVAGETLNCNVRWVNIEPFLDDEAVVRLIN